MFGLSSPPFPPNAPRGPFTGLSTLGAMFGLGNNSNSNNNVDDALGGKRGGGADGTNMWEDGRGGESVARGMMSAGPSEAEEDPLPLDILPGNSHPLAIDRRVDDLLRLLRPAPRAEGYRRSVFRFVTKQVRIRVY